MTNSDRNMWHWNEIEKKESVVLHRAVCIYTCNHTIGTVAGTVSPSLVMMETETDQRAPLHKDVKVVVLAVCSAVALCLSLLGVCFCLKRSKLITRYKSMRIQVSIPVKIYIVIWIMTCSLAGGYHVLEKILRTYIFNWRWR